MSGQGSRLFFVRPWLLAGAIGGAGLTWYRSPPGRLEAGPLLYCMAAGQLLLHALGNWLFARWYPFPRELRGLHALETARIAWASGVRFAARRQGTTAMLLHASRAAGFAKVRAKLERAILAIATQATDDDESSASVGREIDECIREHAAQSIRPRQVPDVPWPVRLAELEPIRMLAAGIAISVLAWWLLGLIVSPTFVLGERAPRLALAVAFTYTIVWPIVLCSALRENYGRLARFRTLLVSDRAADDPTTARLERSLSVLGEVLSVMVVDEPGDDRPPTNFGLRTATVERTKLPLVLDAHMQHTDLVVAITEDSGVTSAIAGRSPLPSARHWQVAEKPHPAFAPLSEGNVAAAALISRLREQTGTALGEVAGLASSYASWRLIYLSSGASLLLGIALLPFRAWTFVGALYVLAGVLGAFPKYLGTRRRELRGQTILRAPRFLGLSHYLSNHVPLWLSLHVTGILCAYSAYRVAIDTTGTGGWTKTLLWVTMLPAYLTVQTMLVPGLVRAIKWGVDWNFRIVVLRRNSPHSSGWHKSIVLPICGAYGQVLLIEDRHFKEGKVPMWGTEVHEALAETFYTLTVDRDVEDWRSLIERELERTDFAVFDWCSEVTPAMRWELDEALRLLPVDRILILCSTTNKLEIAATLLGSKPDQQVILLLALPGSSSAAASTLRTLLHTIMARLSAEPRIQAPQRPTSPPSAATG